MCMQGLQSRFIFFVDRLVSCVTCIIRPATFVVFTCVSVSPILSNAQPVQPGYPELIQLPHPEFKHKNLETLPMPSGDIKGIGLSESKTSAGLLNRFYALQKTDRPAAENTLLILLKTDPNNAVALSELGYIYIEDDKPEEALSVFKSAYQITDDYKIAAQIGYLLDGLGRKKEAYYYFEKASHSPDLKLRQQSNAAMTNLAGFRTKFLSDPYFADIYLSPLYYTRFGLAVFPFQGRFGVALGKNKQWELYVGTRGARDGKSQASGTSPQIFEDNAIIFNLGIRYQPFYTVPLYFYGEVGKGYDLLYQDRPRWKNDFRGGAFYQTAWGAVPTYAENFKFTFKPIGDVYADSSYYSRYNNNLISSINLRQGFRVMEYKSSSLAIYLRAFGIVDTNHEFYNNLVEIGPGIIWVPNNRYNMDFRFERVRGYYFNVNSPDPNPYGSNYNNDVVMFELYQRY